MSKFVKDAITQDLRRRWQGVDGALLASVTGMDAVTNNRLRHEFDKQNIRLLVVKNSLAKRATEGTPLAAAFEQMEGSLAVLWGSQDMVSLAKAVTKLAGEKAFGKFQPKGGVMDGARLTAEQVKQVSKWPTREEQISILLGQILSPGATLASQLTSSGGALASQIEQKAKADGGEASDDAATPTEAPASAPAESASANAAP